MSDVPDAGSLGHVVADGKDVDDRFRSSFAYDLMNPKGENDGILRV